MLTFMDKHRLITLYSQKIAIAKADDITDIWRIIYNIRLMLNEVNNKKASITPTYTKRKKPPVFEIYAKLPKLNCGECGQKSCMAFAAVMQNGSAKPLSCKPIFTEKYTHLLDGYMEMCSSLGLEIM